MFKFITSKTTFVRVCLVSGMNKRFFVFSYFMSIITLFPFNHFFPSILVYCIRKESYTT